MVIEFGAAKDAANRKAHHVSLREAEAFTEAALVLPTYPGTDRIRFIMVEALAIGLMTAIVTPRGDRMRVISLRRANRKEERLYEAATRNR